MATQWLVTTKHIVTAESGEALLEVINDERAAWGLDPLTGEGAVNIAIFETVEHYHVGNMLDYVKEANQRIDPLTEEEARKYEF